MSVPVKPLRLTRVLHVPQLSHKLLSVRQLCHDNNCSVIFDSDFDHFKDNTMGEVLLQVLSVGKVYAVYLPAESPLAPAILAFSSSGEHW